MRAAGYYEFFVMLAATLLGFLGAPWWVTIAIAVLLTLSTLEEYGHLQPRLMRAGAARLMGGAVHAAGAMSIAFAALCYGGGRALGWLVG
jgi:hypothetical protein